MIGHTIEVRDDTAWITFKSGQVTLEAWRNAFDALLSDPRFRPGMACLWDWSAASHGSLSPHDRETMALITAQRRLERGNGRTAIVVARDVDFGTARAYQLKFEDGVAANIRPFRDMDDAEEWLRSASGQAESEVTDP